MTVAQALAAATRRLAAAGVESPRLDARVLLGHLLGVEPLALLTRDDRALSPDEQAAFDALVARREAREPVSRILGRRGFWTLDLSLGPDTLDPRPDTETLVEAVLARLPDRQAPLTLVDFGTGTGCILLALLSELPRARGIGLDISPGALAVASANARANGLAERAAFVAGDWGGALAGPFDVIVSNPPYIPDADIAGLEPEVATWDPRRALAGGADGLDCYRLLAGEIARLLRPGGLAALEVGQGQDDAVATLLAEAGLTGVETVADLAGIGRCVLGRKTL